MKKVIPVFLLLFSFSSYCQDMRKVADSIRRYRRVPALAYAVVTGDSVYQMGAVGYKRLRTKDSIGIDNRFHLGSATASLTGFIAARLVAEGKISWNTTLFQLFPEMKAKARKEYGNPVFSDVLSHRTGFPLFNNYLQLSKLPGFPGPPPEKRKTTVAWLLEQKNVGRDSTGKKGFIFSNVNTLVAAAMIEKASGKSWEALLEEYINKPFGISVKLGMPSRLDINEPWGHWIEGGVFSPLPPTHWFGLNPSMAPAADANISLPDYIKFVQDELRGLNGTKAMLPKRSYEVIHYGYPVYSFGWLNLEVNGNHISESDGTIGTFYSHVEILKEKNLAVIVMANSGDNGAKGAVLNLARALRERYVKL